MREFWILSTALSLVLAGCSIGLSQNARKLAAHQISVRIEVRNEVYPAGHDENGRSTVDNCTANEGVPLTGTGIIFGADAEWLYVATVHHVVACPSAQIYVSNETWPARQVAAERITGAPQEVMPQGSDLLPLGGLSDVAILRVRRTSLQPKYTLPIPYWRVLPKAGVMPAASDRLRVLGSTHGLTKGEPGEARLMPMKGSEPSKLVVRVESNTGPGDSGAGLFDENWGLLGLYTGTEVSTPATSPPGEPRNAVAYSYPYRFDFLREAIDAAGKEHRVAVALEESGQDVSWPVWVAAVSGGLALALAGTAYKIRTDYYDHPTEANRGRLGWVTPLNVGADLLGLTFLGFSVYCTYLHLDAYGEARTIRERRATR